MPRTGLSAAKPHRRELIGALRLERRAGDFRIGQWLSPASTPRIEPHGHDTAHVVIVTAGSFQTEASGDDRAGPVIVFNPAGTWHSDHFDGQGAFVGITLSSRASRLAHELALPSHPVRLQRGSAWGIASRLMRTAPAATDPLDEGSLEALCFELIGEAESGRRVDAAVPSWLRRAAECLRDGDDSAGIETVARFIGVHPVHLTRSFRRYFRCTPGEYVRAHRVSRAADMLARCRMSIAQVAAECSFADQSHLVRSFRRHFGMTPQQFRLDLA